MIFFDAIRIKGCEEGTELDKALCVTLSVRADGAREILGLWIERSEAAKFREERAENPRLRECADRHCRPPERVRRWRVRAPEAISGNFPQAQVQVCVVLPIRHALAFVSCKDRIAAVALKQIYEAKDADADQLERTAA